jgi:CO/xanthine dehydrogenase FAD-binding subunit
MPHVHGLLNLREYHRPAVEDGGLARALELLARPSPHTVPLAGGDTLLASADPAIEAVVDLQGLGLDAIASTGRGHLHIGAMVTRAQLAEDDIVRTAAYGILREGARRWSGNVQRNRATIGGSLATAAANDPLVVALLACEALVTLASRQGSRAVPIHEFLAQRPTLLAAPALITEVVVSKLSHTSGAGLASVARTPADAPIVLAAAVLGWEGNRCTHACLALGGVAPTPIRSPEAEALLSGQTLSDQRIEAAANRAASLVAPTGDFRGSAEYRREMAGVLAERALRQAWKTGGGA